MKIGGIRYPAVQICEGHGGYGYPSYPCKLCLWVYRIYSSLKRSLLVHIYNEQGLNVQLYFAPQFDACIINFQIEFLQSYFVVTVNMEVRRRRVKCIGVYSLHISIIIGNCLGRIQNQTYTYTHFITLYIHEVSKNDA